MLDLLLLRAEQAYEIVLASADAIPSELELRRIKLSDQFVEMMLEALIAIAKSDGPGTLSARKCEIAEFGELFCNVLWHMASWDEQRQQLIHENLCPQCRANLRKRRYKFN